MRRRGQTLVEFMLVLGALACGVLVAWWAGHKWGWVGYVVGAAVGAVGGFFLMLGGIAALASLVMMWYGWPPYPGCASGTCEREDHTCEVVEQQVHWVCVCGRRYCRKGRQFMQVDAEGALQPYLVWKPFRGWFPDETST